jgi:hypothetical protein
MGDIDLFLSSWDARNPQEDRVLCVYAKSQKFMRQNKKSNKKTQNFLEKS